MAGVNGRTERPDRWLKVSQVQARLGLGRSLVYELISSGELPSVTIGRARRVPEHCLIEWMRAREAAAAA